MGILVGDFAIQYEAFDNMLAAGKQNSEYFLKEKLKGNVICARPPPQKLRFFFLTFRASAYFLQQRP